MNNTNSIALILISCGLFFFFGKPMIADLSDLLAKKAEYTDALAKINSIQETTSSLTTKLNALSDTEKSQIQVLLPGKPDTVKFISDIDSAASKQGISIDNISYNNVNTDTSGSVAGAPPPNDYSSMMLNFSFASDYPHLKAFLTDLESSLRLMDIRQVSLAVGEKGVFTYRVSAEIYWMPLSNIK